MPDTAPMVLNAQADCIRVIPTGGALGARIEGLDRTQPCDPATHAALTRAWLDHQLLLVPGAPMTPGQMRDFSAIFGEVVPQLLRYKRVGELPEVSRMESTLKPDGGTDKTAIRAERWH